MEFEKLGAFYLGRRFDAQGDAITDESILYDAKDLTTHAMCVGMTGSGKTGLCLGLLEEAALDGIPAICIDPKGDLGNLLLTFPKLRAQDFAPWVDPADARGSSVDERASELASRWKEGLAEWGQDGARIQRFRGAADIAIYTPGSQTGLGISVLRSLSAPGDLDADAMRERVQSSVSGLLSMVGIDADPIQSREHVFLSNVLHQAWSKGESLELGALVRAVLEPPFARVGVLDLDSFFPAKDRQALAMALNGLLASPGFSAWLEGEPLDAKSLLWTSEGKPRISIINIAHLSDAERMFFVTLLLNEVVTWMRTQPGTSSLRALLYMDEVFGFLPPVKAPPSKTLFLTLLKQARAYGLGLVLATQNPVDLDYKAVSNCGTWFLGRLQTEGDVNRVIDGLMGSGANLDVDALRKTLAGLDSRVFLLHNVHDDEPVLFHTRWVMSFLRGPLSKPQIKELMSSRRTEVQDKAVPAAIAGAAASAPGTVAAPAVSERPAIDAEIDEVFLGEPVGELTYEPAFLATVQLHHANARYDIDEWSTRTLIAPIREATPAQLWKDSHVTRAEQLVENDEPVAGAGWGELPRGALTKSRLRSVQSALKKHLYKEEAITIFRCRDLKLMGEAGEDQAAFVARCRLAMREKRDEEVDKVKAKFAKKHAALMKKVRRAEDKVAREKSQVKDKQVDTALSVGTTVLGAIFGRRATVAGHARRAASAARRGSKVLKEKEDVKRAELALADLQQEVVDLDEELQWALTEVKADASEVPSIDEVKVAPKKTDMAVERFVLAWVPV